MAAAAGAVSPQAYTTWHVSEEKVMHKPYRFAGLLSIATAQNTYIFYLTEQNNEKSEEMPYV